MYEYIFIAYLNIYHKYDKLKFMFIDKQLDLTRSYTSDIYILTCASQLFRFLKNLYYILSSP